MPTPTQAPDSSTLLRARVAALLELPGFEQVVAAWLQALARLTIASKSRGRRAYLSAVTDLLHATEEALTIMPVSWTRVLPPQCSPGRAARLPRRTAPQLDTAFPITQLTPREQEVAALVAQGLTNKQIAGALVVCDATAERHVANILSKLGLRSRVEIAIRSFERERH